VGRSRRDHVENRFELPRGLPAQQASALSQRRQKNLSRSSSQATTSASFDGKLR
jgi:hypothetical protein